MGDFKTILSGLVIAGGFCIAGAQSTVTLSGTVTNSSDTKVVAGAKVYLAANPNITATTGADGNFVLSGQATVGLRSGIGAVASGVSFHGNLISITVDKDNTPVSIDVYNLKNQFVRNLVDRNAAAGEYAVNSLPAGLNDGMYLVRARVGNRVSAFKMTTLGFSAVFKGMVATPAGARNALAKGAVDYIDTLKVTKDGFKILSKPIAKYSGILTVAITPKLTPGDLKIVSERNFPQVAWGKNVDVQVWEGGTQLEGAYKASSFEGGQSWMVKFLDTQLYSAWGFVSTVEPEDMSAWKGGTMHLAVRGTVSSIGVTMASADQGGGTSVKVNLANYGYVPMTSVTDTAWHEVKIPMDDFVGVDLSQVNIYCGLVTPVESDTTPFDPTTFYLVDDIYWSLKK